MRQNTLGAFSDELEKISWDWKKFREGVTDEGVPLAGATIGAALGAKSGHGLRGAALGYAAGGGASLARSKLKGEKPSFSRKLLAAGALGYGAGGMAHAGLSSATKNMDKGKLLHRAFHVDKSTLHGFAEEAMPAAGATLATGAAYATEKKKPGIQKTADSFLTPAAKAAVRSAKGGSASAVANTGRAFHKMSPQLENVGGASSVLPKPKFDIHSAREQQGFSALAGLRGR